MRLRTLLAAGAMALVTGCGANAGFLRDSATVQQTQFRMDVASVRYLRSASGSAEIGSALCFIPMGDNAYEQAMQRLYTAANLQFNEVLSNFREDHTYRIFLGLYCSKKLTISADVIRFGPTAAAPR